MTPSTDIIIPFRSTAEFRTGECLKTCISSLLQHTHNFRLIFVDDNSDEEGREFLHKVALAFPECTVVRNYKQRWFTRAVNLGLRLVRTPWCVELNSDVTLNEGWLEELYSVVEDIQTTWVDRKVGLVGSVHSPHDPRRYIITQPPDYVTGHCWLINMVAAKEVNYLDETQIKTIHIFSDNHFCYDMNRLGWVTARAHHSKVDHVAGQSWGHQIHRIPHSLESVNFHYGN